MSDKMDHRAELKKEDKKESSKRILKWLKDVKVELKKIIWPTKQQVINNTLAVLFMILIFGAFVWVLDAGFGLPINYIIRNI